MSSQTNSLKQASGEKSISRDEGALSGLKEGSIFEGTISSKENGQVTIALSDGQKVTARLDEGVNIKEGQSMFFQVKSMTDTSIAIKPYDMGQGANPTLVNALKQANISVDARSLSMVNAMMEQNMSIDKNSLNQMMRTALSNENIDIKTLVMLKKFDIPITVENASQFENYLNDKQAITGKIEQFMNDLPEQLANAKVDANQLQQSNKAVLDIISQDMDKTPVGEIMSEKAVVTLKEAIEGFVKEMFNKPPESVNSSLNQNPMQNHQTASDNVNVQLVNQNNSQQIAQGQAQVIEQTQSQAQGTEQPQVQGQGIEQPQTQGQGIEQAQLQGQGTEQSQVQSQAQVAQESQSQATTQEQGTAKIADIPRELFNISKESNLQDLMQGLKIVLSQDNFSKESLVKLFSNSGYKELITKSLEKQWLLEPEELKTEGKIQNLYEKMNNQIQQMDNVLKAVGQNSNAFSQISGEIQSNIEFMNQINQAYTYLQVPLKMANQNANGELYVYTKKNKAIEGKEDLTAFLHLEMDNLGTTDVSIKLHLKELTTNFYVEDEKSYELIEKNLPRLEKILNKKGYTCNLLITNEEKKVNFVEDFLKKDRPSAGPVRRYSFDMRA
ncbi:hook-length control protein FliK [Lachnospiraceae bacterium C7]|nr:hook-length control protein FliK [Lachnospiraceae bacterium C7]